MKTRSRRRTRCIFWRSLHTLPINLAIKRSSLPGASYGIWSKEYIPVGTRFGPYSDITSEDLDSEEKNDCSSEVEKKKNDLDILESREETQPNWLGYINCTRNEVQQNLLGFHLQSHQGEVELYYLSYKPIPANTELLIWHSKTYTKTLGIEPKDYTYYGNELNSITYSEYSKKKKMTKEKTINDDLQNSVFCLEITNNGIKKPKIVYNNIHENVFMKDRTLDYEERLYTKANPFVCYICYYNFSSIKELQVHIRAHAGRSTYECDICHKVFSRIYSLHSHKMTHSANAEKPYVCNVCDKRYSKRRYLKKHTMAHLIEEARLQYVS